jgi:hypothetical protein
MDLVIDRGGWRSKPSGSEKIRLAFCFGEEAAPADLESSLCHSFLSPSAARTSDKENRKKFSMILEDKCLY